MSTLPPDDDDQFGDDFADEVAGLDAPPPYDWDDEPPLAEQPWTITNALNYGWQKYTDNIWQMILAGIGLVVLFVAFDYVGSVIDGALTSAPHCVAGAGCSGGSGTAWSWTAFWISWIPSFVVLQMAMTVLIRGALAVTRGERFDIRTAIHELHWTDVAVLTLILTGIALVGLWLAVVPGVVAIFFTSYALYIQADRGVLPTDALKVSLRFVRDNVAKTALWFIVGGLVAVAGLCLCGIGAALTVPLVVIGTAWTYRKLQNQRTV